MTRIEMKPRIQKYFDRLVIDICIATSGPISYKVWRTDCPWLQYFKRLGLIDYTPEHFDEPQSVLLTDGAWRHASDRAQERWLRMHREQAVFLLGGDPWREQRNEEGVELWKLDGWDGS